MKIVASQSRLLEDALAARGFRAVGAEPIWAAEAALLDSVRMHKPQLVVVVESQAVHGFALCQRIKRDPELRGTRVLVAIDREPEQVSLTAVAASGSDEALLMRLPGEELYPACARLCGLPNLSLSQPAEVRDPSWSAPAVPRHAEAANLQPRSVDLLSDRPLQAGSRVRVTLRRTADGPPLELEGEVARSDGGAGRPFRARVQFPDVPSAAQQRLHDLSLWEARPLAADTLRVEIRGAFDQASDFTALSERITAESARGVTRCVFDLSRVRQITSWGARAWILFLRGLPASLRYPFVNGSTLFSRHCSMVADMLGPGEVLSFALPYECSGCSSERARVVHVSWVSASVKNEPPPFRCPSCGELERFAELPDRYFSFLRA